MAIGNQRDLGECLRHLLREVRLSAGLRQADLAALLNQPQSFVSKYETGERRLDFLEIRQVCEATGVTVEDFARRFEEMLGEAR
jgi:transcriptional regulator with XRE-family HTH domain